MVKWKDGKAKVTSRQFYEALTKQMVRKFGDFGLAVCGPRFRVEPILLEGLLIVVRREAQEYLRRILSDEFTALKTVHISGSLSLAKRAIARKFPKCQQSDLDVLI